MYIQVGKTVMTLDPLNTLISQLSFRDKVKKLTGFDQQLKARNIKWTSNHKTMVNHKCIFSKRSCQIKLSVYESAGDHRSENREKSRDVTLQPREITLTSFIHLLETSSFLVSLKSAVCRWRCNCGSTVATQNIRTNYSCHIWEEFVCETPVSLHVVWEEFVCLFVCLWNPSVAM